MQEQDTKHSCCQRIEDGEDAGAFRCCVFLPERLDREAYSTADHGERKHCTPFGTALRQPDFFKDKCPNICKDRYKKKLINRDCHEIIIFCCFVCDKDAYGIPEGSSENQKFTCCETDMISFQREETHTDHGDDSGNDSVFIWKFLLKEAGDSRDHDNDGTFEKGCDRRWCGLQAIKLEYHCEEKENSDQSAVPERPEIDFGETFVEQKRDQNKGNRESESYGKEWAHRAHRNFAEQ